MFKTNPLINTIKIKIFILVVIFCGLENICENILNWEWELSVSSQASKCVFNYLQDNFYDHNCSSLNFLFNHFSLHTTCICNISSQSCQNIWYLIKWHGIPDSFYFVSWAGKSIATLLPYQFRCNGKTKMLFLLFILFIIFNPAIKHIHISLFAS